LIDAAWAERFDHSQPQCQPLLHESSVNLTPA
jgi:hypothetical protein